MAKGKRKRDCLNSDETETQRPKRTPLTPQKNDPQVPMEIGLLSIGSLHEGLQLIVSAFLGMFFMLVIANAIKIG